MGSEKGSTRRNFIVCTTPNIVRMTKSRRLSSAGHVGRMEGSRSAFKILTGKPAGKVLGVDGRTILEWILKE